jgi:segregation and condensation protein B
MSEMPDSPELTPADPESARPKDENHVPAPEEARGDAVSEIPVGSESMEAEQRPEAAVDVLQPDAVDAAETEAAAEEADEPFTDEESAELRNIVESLVFASDEPIQAKFMRQIIEDINKDRVEGNRVRATTEGIKRAVAAINRTYGDRAFHIIAIAGGFAFATKPKYSAFVGKLAKEKARRKLSATAIESLAIIAYKQPITKSEIEFIRGVNADYIIKTLLEKNLITITGRATTPGRPLLYGTTDEFLKHFGLNEITDLPKPREIEELIGETEREVEKRMLADQQELEFKEELQQKMDGGEKPKPHATRAPLRQPVGQNTIQQIENKNAPPAAAPSAPASGEESHQEPIPAIESGQDPVAEPIHEADAIQDAEPARESDAIQEVESLTEEQDTLLDADRDKDTTLTVELVQLRETASDLEITQDIDAERERQAEEELRAAAELKQVEEEWRAEEDLIQVDDELRAAEEVRAAEEFKAEEELRVAEELRIAEEFRAAEARQAEEELNAAEKLRAEEELKAAEELKAREEEARAAGELRAAEELRVAQELKESEERKAAEELKAAEEREAREFEALLEEEARDREAALMRDAAEKLKISEDLRAAEERKATEERKAAEEMKAAEELQAAEQEETRKREAEEDRIAAEEREAQKIAEAAVEQETAAVLDEPAATTETPPAETQDQEEQSVDARSGIHDDEATADGESHGTEKGWSKWKTKIKTFFKKLFV